MSLLVQAEPVGSVKIYIATSLRECILCFLVVIVQCAGNILCKTICISWGIDSTCSIICSVLFYSAAAAVFNHYLIQSTTNIAQLTCWEGEEFQMGNHKSQQWQRGDDKDKNSNIYWNNCGNLSVGILHIKLVIKSAPLITIKS